MELTLISQACNLLDTIAHGAGELVSAAIDIVVKGAQEKCKTNPSLPYCQSLDSYQTPSGSKGLAYGNRSEAETRRFCRQWPDTLISLIQMNASGSRISSRQLVKDAEADVARDCKPGQPTNPRCDRSQDLLSVSRMVQLGAQLNDEIPRFDPAQVEQDCLARNGLSPDAKAAPSKRP